MTLLDGSFGHPLQHHIHGWELMLGNLVIASTLLYRASHVLEDWVLLTWIWNVPSPCLGSK